MSVSNELPVFSEIKIEEIEPALEALLQKNRQRVDALLMTADINGEDFLNHMEQWSDEVEALWSPVSHLNGVKNSDELRDAYNGCLSKLTEYATQMGQNKALYQAYKTIAQSKAFSQLDIAQQKSVNNALRDFTLSGVALEDKQKNRFGEIKARLAELSTKFSNNLLDATHGWFKHVSTAADLKGVPAMAMQLFQEAARAKEMSGFVITLDIPAYLPVMQYCDNAALREELYYAYTTRASDQGLAIDGDVSEWDNSSLMGEILCLRYELAQLLGFNNYAEYSLATKMAETPAQVEQFLRDLAEKSLSVAKKDYAELEAFAKQQGAATLNAWDVAYYSEKLRVEKYAISQEELRPYFPVEKVIAGMFSITGKLFDVEFEKGQVDSWHSDVRFYHIKRNGNVIAKFYLDLFAREHKRGGAWMADCRVKRMLADGQQQIPVAFLTCNFTSPTADVPSLLTHNEVTTLFHEFGNGLHHMLTQVECAAVSGINGVPWDAVELPSQFMENWCWEKEAIPLISEHYQSGEVLPAQMLEKLLAARNFQSGMQMMRQLEFALFDLQIHQQQDSVDSHSIQTLLNNVRNELAVYEVPAFNRFQHGFSHIFAGGYAAGYYSYKWAEVLSADAFSRFEEEGIFNEQIGLRFLHEILEQGGSKEPMELFSNFRGREPSVEALLRHSGIVNGRPV